MKVTLYMAQTVNGYIAKVNDETPWSDEEWDSYSKMTKSFRNLIVGRKTYEIMKKENEFQSLGDPFVVVLTKSKVDGKSVFAKSPQEALEILKERGFNKVLVGGGANTNSSFMKEKFVDEIILDIEPLVFGKGIKLFADGDFEAKLELVDVKKLSENTVQLWYDVKS